MKVLRRHLHASTWFALVAVLGMALLPTLSHALAFSQGEPRVWAEICTPQGMKRVAVDSLSGEAAGTTDPATSAAGHLEHCPWCTLSAPAAGLPPAPPSVPIVSAAAEHLPRWLQAPRTLWAWGSAQPRAPPSQA
ncbi:MAG: DUF2946 domain-containing protein [Rubrivivax sp.]|nr:DUF2946 domain-containing protein [Rubrivivax sp.]MDP3610214.1 DUF2946 domain-containing protein [Rubrivivax sp.]